MTSRNQIRSNEHLVFFVENSEKISIWVLGRLNFITNAKTPSPAGNNQYGATRISPLLLIGTIELADFLIIKSRPSIEQISLVTFRINEEQKPEVERSLNLEEFKIFSILDFDTAEEAYSKLRKIVENETVSSNSLPNSVVAHWVRDMYERIEDFRIQSHWTKNADDRLVFIEVHFEAMSGTGKQKRPDGTDSGSVSFSTPILFEIEDEVKRLLS